MRSGAPSRIFACPESGLLRPDEVEGIFKPLTDATPLPPRIYVDDDVFAAEQARILRREWLPVGVADQVRDPGDFFTIDVLGEPLLVVRDDAGAVRTFYNVCRHRAMLVTSGCGNASFFECPYHAWTYDRQGRLVKAVHMERTAAFRQEEIALIEVRTEVWQGFVMINFDPDAEPLAPRLTELAKFLEPWDLPNMRLIIDKPFQCPWNWKIMLENANEGYHVMALHRDSAQTAIPAEGITTEPLDGQAYSLFHLPYVEGLDDAKDWMGRAEKAPYIPPAIPGLPDSASKQVEFIFVWPCLHFSVQHDSMTSFPIVPHTRDSITFSWRHHLPASSVGADGFEDYADAQGSMMERIQSEDTIAGMGVQRGWSSAGAAPTCLSHLEETTWQFHRWYAQRMRA